MLGQQGAAKLLITESKIRKMSPRTPNPPTSPIHNRSHNPPPSALHLHSLQRPPQISQTLAHGIKQITAQPSCTDHSRPSSRSTACRTNTARHKHFTLSDDEYLVDVRGTSTAHRIAPDKTVPTLWDVEIDNDTDTDTDAGDDGAVLRPLEFALRASAPPHRPLVELAEFLAESAAAVKTLGVIGLFAICAHPGLDYPGRVEITVGRADINLTPEEGRALFPDEGMSEAAWFFDEGFTRRGCTCTCRLDGDNHGHGGHRTVRKR
ncbi:hypothetical protein MRB53_040104 [Persea americana]|nr:hypothetical protein MRB53_040104 [Persea americana]